jgi:hypothetical protein
MKCRRYLNQSLQKRLLRLFRLEPNTFPMLVSKEEFLVPITLQAFRKGAVIPIKGHSLPIIIHIPDR